MPALMPVPAAFLKMFDDFEALPDKAREELVENNSGELNLVCGFWKQASQYLPDNREFDPCDAGYIMLGLRDIHQAQYMLMVRDPAVLSVFWELSIRTATALMDQVDFNDEYDFGVFCYEHLGTEPGELVYRLYHEVYERLGNVNELVADFAQSKGWPLL